MRRQLVCLITAFFRILPAVLRKECQFNGSYPLHLEGMPCRGNDTPPPQFPNIQPNRPAPRTRHTCVFLQYWLRRTSSALMTMDSTPTVIRATSTGNATAESRNSRPVATDWPSTPPTPSSWQRTAITCTTSTAATGQDLVSVLTFAIGQDLVSVLTFGGQSLAHECGIVIWQAPSVTSCRLAHQINAALRAVRIDKPFLSDKIGTACGFKKPMAKWLSHLFPFVLFHSIFYNTISYFPLKYFFYLNQ